MAKRFQLSRFVSLPLLAGIVIGVLATSGAIASFRGSAVFTDVPAGAYYDDAVGEMYGLGIIRGYDSSHFGPDDYVTRGQIAVLMKRLRDEVKGISPTASSSSSVSSVVSSSSSSSSSTSSSSSSSSSLAQTANAVSGSFHFTSSAFSIPDAAPSIAISVIRSGGSQGAVAVAYTLSGGTAVSGVDFAATQGVLSFATGETTKNITARLIKNTSASGNRTINLTLSNPAGGATIMAPASAVVTITHSGLSTSSSSSSVAAAGTGGVMSFSAVSFGVMENAATATVTVVRNGSTSLPVTIDFVTTNGSAIDGTDYTRTAMTLSFAAFEASKTVSIPIRNNSIADGSRIVNLSLNTPTGGASIGIPSPATLSIIDDELGPYGSGHIMITNSSTAALESDKYAYVKVSRIDEIEKTASVTFSMIDDSARSGIDYTGSLGTITFNPGELQKYIVAPLLSRAGNQGSRSFKVLLGSPTGAQLGTTVEAYVNIEG